jgi:hypothetical protein
VFYKDVEGQSKLDNQEKLATRRRKTKQKYVSQTLFGGHTYLLINKIVLANTERNG